jgi:hypothetical protein
MEAVDKLAKLWDMGEDEDRAGMAKSLFTYVVWDLDIRRIVDFRLKPWADRFLTLRAALYEDKNGSTEPENDTASAGQELRQAMPPRGYHTMARGNRSNARAVLLAWLYRGLADPIPQNFKHRKREARNKEIRLKYADGRDAFELAADYGVSAKRIYQIVHHQRK